MRAFTPTRFSEVRFSEVIVPIIIRKVALRRLRYIDCPTRFSKATQVSIWNCNSQYTETYVHELHSLIVYSLLILLHTCMFSYRERILRCLHAPRT